MSFAGAPVTEPFPPIALDLDDVTRAHLQAAWQLVSVHGDEPIVADRIRVVANAVVNQQIVIAFGGHWSAGKSTLINALLGRDLLPTSERTETGAPCRIRAGAADQALSIRDHYAIEFPCTREALAEQVSITLGGAEPRPEVAAVEAVELTLSLAPLPANVCWIDTPGLNDVPEAEERLRREVDRADQLLWVLNPDQLLAEVEQRFLADHVARRGAGSVAFLINVRTHQHPESDWRRFQDEGWPAHRARIEHFWDALGLPADSRPPVLIVSGAHLCAEFGAADLGRFLSAADGVLARRVVSARVTSLTAVMAEVSSEIERRARESEARIEEQRRAQADRERRLATFRSTATANIIEILADVRELLRGIGAQLAARSRSSTAHSEAAMATQLRSEMHRLLLDRWNAVVASLGDAAARAGIGAPTVEMMGAVAADLAVPPITISSPAVAPPGGCAIGLWGCAFPFMALLWIVKIVSGHEADQRAHDLPRRVDEAILSAAAAHVGQVPVAVDHAIKRYAKD